MAELGKTSSAGLRAEPSDPLRFEETGLDRHGRITCVSFGSLFVHLAVVKTCTQNGVLVNGSMDQNLRSPGGLVLAHTHLSERVHPNSDVQILPC